MITTICQRTDFKIEHNPHIIKNFKRLERKNVNYYNKKTNILIDVQTNKIKYYIQQQSTTIE